MLVISGYTVITDALQTGHPVVENKRLVIVASVAINADYARCSSQRFSGSNYVNVIPRSIEIINIFNFDRKIGCVSS